MVELQISIAELFDSRLEFVGVELIEAVLEKIFESVGNGNKLVETTLKEARILTIS